MEINKDENIHRFELIAIRGEVLEREREKKERNPHNLEREVQWTIQKRKGWVKAKIG